MLNVKLLNFFIALLIVSKFEIAFHFPVLSALTEAVRQKGSGIPGAKEKAPYVPGSTHRAGIVPDDGGRPKWAQLWQVSILPTTNSPYGAAIFWPPANQSYELSALCALLVRHSILFFKVHYRPGLSPVAVLPWASFPVDGYILLISSLFYEDRKWPLNGPQISDI